MNSLKFLFLAVCILFFNISWSQLRPEDYDDVDFVFDSIYSANYNKYKSEQDSIKIQKLISDLNSMIDMAAVNDELTFSGVGIQTMPNRVLELKGIKKLVFNNCKKLNTEKLFEQLAQLPNLTSLSFINCGLYSLPISIKNLSNLEYLSVKENKIVVLPTELAQLKQLNTLDVSNNTILNEDMLFELLPSLPKLKTLNANYCNIRTIPVSAASLPLTRLELAANLLKEMPNGLKIEQLDLSSNPYFNATTLLTSLATYPSLKELDLSYNKWDVLPSSIGKLSKLNALNLRGNKLTVLPDEIGSLSSLRVLKIDNPDKFIYTNQLASLPTSIGKLTKLDSLFLSGNKLTSLPSGFSTLTALKYVDLGYNKLETFPKEILSLSNLNYLDLSLNHVKTIPVELGNLSNLEYLNLQGDFFVNYQLKIKTLPESIGKLTKLKTLILADNVIEILPESIGNCKELIHFDVKDNLLSTLPNAIGQLQNLKELNVKANEIKTLPDAFGNLGNLNHLNLAFNIDINDAQSAVILGKLKNLSTLNISDCYFTEQVALQLIKALPNTEIITQVERKEKKDE